MKLKRIGFFRELSHGSPSGLSLKESVRSSSPYLKDRVIAYLRTAPLFIASPGLVRDELDADKPLFGPAHIRTDGVWAWPQDLAHYVAKYGVELDADFLSHLASRDYKPPAEGDVNLPDLELQ